MKMAYQAAEQRAIVQQTGLIAVLAGLPVVAMVVMVDHLNWSWSPFMPVPRITASRMGVDQGGRQNPPRHHKG